MNQAGSWFADTTNGITDFFAKIGHFDEVCAKNSEGTETCVDGDQLKSLLGASAAGAPALGDGGGDEAPATSPAQDESEPPEDTAPATTTTPVSDDRISSPAADDPVDEDEPTEPAEADPEAEELEEADEPLLPEAANDNAPQPSAKAT